MARLFNIIRIGVFAQAILIVLAWLLGLVLTDRLAWSQWLWWIPTQAVIASSALAFIFAFIPGESKRLWLWRSSISMFVCVVVIGYFMFVEHRMLESVKRIDRGTTLRIMHINASRGYEDTAGQIGATIDRIEPDVIIFSFAWWSTNRIANASAFGSAYQTVARRPFSILSRLPIIESREIVNNEGVAIAFARVETAPGRTMTILMIDLPSDPHIRRMDLAQKVRGWLNDADAPDPDLVIGDFNITRGSASLDVLFPGYAHAFATAGVGYGATFPATPIYHIDHTLHSEDQQIVQYYICDDSLGPHRAQVIDVTR